MSRSRRGMTLVEVVIASVVGALVAGGTMLAFVMAMNMTRQGSADEAEAMFYTEQTLERFRNRMACDDPWFDPARCSSNGAAGPDTLPTPPPNVNSSLLREQAVRDYEIVPEDCDGVGGPGDCYRVTARVQWTPPK